MKNIDKWGAFLRLVYNKFVAHNFLLLSPYKSNQQVVWHVCIDVYRIATLILQVSFPVEKEIQYRHKIPAISLHQFRTLYKSDKFHWRSIYFQYLLFTQFSEYVGEIIFYRNKLNSRYSKNPHLRPKHGLRRRFFTRHPLRPLEEEDRCTRYTSLFSHRCSVIVSMRQHLVVLVRHVVITEFSAKYHPLYG